MTLNVKSHFKTLKNLNLHFSINSTQTQLHRAEEYFWNIWWNTFPASCLASSLRDFLPLQMSFHTSLQLFSLSEGGRGKHVSPLRLKAVLQTKSSMLNVAHSCRNPNRNSLARAGHAHRAGQRGNDWERPRGAAGSVPWCLRTRWHQEPRTCGTGRFLATIDKIKLETQPE